MDLPIFQLTCQVLTWTKRRVSEASKKGHSFDEANSGSKIGRNKSYGSTKMVAKLDCNHKIASPKSGTWEGPHNDQRFWSPFYNPIKIASPFLIFNHNHPISWGRIPAGHKQMGIPQIWGLDHPWLKKNLVWRTDLARFTYSGNTS
jgi:hypothetical protein